MLSFSPKTPATKRAYGMDFYKKCALSGSTVSSAVASVLVASGVDANPAALLSGGVSLSNGATNVQTMVSQTLLGGIPGVVYVLKIVATCSDGQILEGQAQLPVVTLLP